VRRFRRRCDPAPFCCYCHRTGCAAENHGLRKSRAGACAPHQTHRIIAVPAGRWTLRVHDFSRVGKCPSAHARHERRGVAACNPGRDERWTMLVSTLLTSAKLRSLIPLRGTHPGEDSPDAYPLCDGWIFHACGCGSTHNAWAFDNQGVSS